MDMKERLQELAENARVRIEESEGLDKLNDVRVAYLGKKGELTACLLYTSTFDTISTVRGVWRSLVARTAGGREVAGSNPVTPIPWQGHGRRSDPSGGLRKRETVYCGVSFLCNRKLRS